MHLNERYSTKYIYSAISTRSVYDTTNSIANSMTQVLISTISVVAIVYPENQYKQ